MILRDLIIRAKLPFRKDKELCRSIYNILGFWPADISLYQEALQHKSQIKRNARGRRITNERLEFLGDAILDAVVADVVYRHFAGKPEGVLTNIRSRIVQRASLNKIACETGLDKLICQSKHTNTNAHNNYLPGNTFEALVGAIYLDRGYYYCMRFMEKQILKSLVNIDKVARNETNFKSKVLEWGQKNRLVVEFQPVEHELQPGATPTFSTKLMVEGILCGEGTGYSKKESQQRAAKEALTHLRQNHKLEASIFEAKSRRTAMEEQPQMLVPEVGGEIKG